ncbi:ribosome maturation factor RimM [Eisenbergiella porci]|uniref:ribosome maturation factor RimM n=1 Tax=Eisenbergiella porci TaxID=2652274 RepID=UPI002A80B160|nr:ribosome maturation factor RimM [Eisenbergiella porci]
MEQKLQVGIITATHGLKGEVKVYPTTDDPGRFRRLKKVILDNGKVSVDLEIESVKYFKQFVILKFKGLDDIEQVEKYRKASLYVTRDNAVRLKKDEFFIADLIDMKVVNEDGSPLGTLRDVITTGANDVYEVALDEGGTVLIPAIKECILDVDVDVENAVMRVHLLEGLLDLQ